MSREDDTLMLAVIVLALGPARSVVAAPSRLPVLGLDVGIEPGIVVQRVDDPLVVTLGFVAGHAMDSVVGVDPYEWLTIGPGTRRRQPDPHLSEFSWIRLSYRQICGRRGVDRGDGLSFGPLHRRLCAGRCVDGCSNRRRDEGGGRHSCCYRQARCDFHERVPFLVSMCSAADNDDVTTCAQPGANLDA